MSEFKNVTVIREANIYFNGRVTSRTVRFEDGSKKTLGFMLVGEYTFNTDAAEVMEVIGGEMQVRLPDASDWITVRQGESFAVPENSNFDLIVKEFADYCCSYETE